MALQNFRQDSWASFHHMPTTPTISFNPTHEVAAQAMELLLEVPKWNPDTWHPALCSSSSQTDRSLVPGWLEGREVCGYLVSLWQVQATGRNPEGWWDWLWLGGGVISWGTVWKKGLRVGWHLQRCSKVAMELSPWARMLQPRVVEIPFLGSAPQWGGVRGKEGRWIRVTRATSCLVFLATPGAKQLYFQWRSVVLWRTEPMFLFLLCFTPQEFIRGNKN